MRPIPGHMLFLQFSEDIKNRKPSIKTLFEKKTEKRKLLYNIVRIQRQKFGYSALLWILRQKFGE